MPQCEVCGKGPPLVSPVFAAGLTNLRIGNLPLLG